jgi:O-antigen/teichoic acid export membrane protein
MAGVSADRVAKNTGLNLLGQVAPAVVAVVTVPYIVAGLGVDRFGLLSLALILVGYLGLFDLGLGRATTRFVAEALSRGDQAAVPEIVWTSVFMQFVFGCLGGLILASSASALVEHVIKVPALMADEARAVIYVVALMLPILICVSSLKGVLEAHQRFDLVNIVRSVSGSLMFLAPALGVRLGYQMPAIMVLLFVSVCATGAAYFALDLAVSSSLRSRAHFDRRRLRSLLGYGGWVTLSGIIVPLLVYSDRLLLSVLTSVAALTYYVIPYELVSRLQVFPTSLGAALFPAFSRSLAMRSPDLKLLYLRSIKYLMLIVAPIALALVLLGRWILAVWLGQGFADQGAIVLQFLAIGVVLNSVSQISAQLLDGVGRPDLRAKVFLSYLPIYLVLAAGLIVLFGVNGAAAAWALRGAIELCLFTAVASRLLRVSIGQIIQSRTPAAVLAFGAVAFAGIASRAWLPLSTGANLSVSIVLIGSFAVGVWLFGTTQDERVRLLRIASGNRLARPGEGNAI